MAIDFFSENPSLGTSPRISFSHDLQHHRDDDDDDSNQSFPCRSVDSSISMAADSCPDFKFWVGDSFGTEPSSSADELFSGGLIRPLQIQQRFVNPKHVSVSSVSTVSKPRTTSSLPPLPSNNNVEVSKQESVNNEVMMKPPSKSFWKIKRSSSLHCENSSKKSSFWSLPLLSRSNSTGSVPSPKQKQQQKSFAAASSSYNNSQKPPLKKYHHGGANYGNGVRISPVLNINVPSPCISGGTTVFFGLGSLFRNGNKEKKNKK
ncbi:uncharacterized protein LOC127792812 [Diospyros lotus]|uniref:uncharacterized protein LOC127792812 n=1 Tax=Diospyros lotus TaxID=55363 RepID=UPI002254DCB1|nr:uncharacterized protein LOC127792812 [Diospyros lotus]